MQRLLLLTLAVIAIGPPIYIQAEVDARSSNSNADPTSGTSAGAKNVELADQTSTGSDARVKRLAEMEATLKELKLEAELAKARQDATLAEWKREQERLQAEASLEAARHKKATQSWNLEAEIRKKENAVLKEKLQKLKSLQDIAQTEHRAHLTRESQHIALADSRDRAKSRVVKEMEYAAEPFRHGELFITDRRISLNGVITASTATYVTERLHFFNNRSSDPIFIVIDSSPGGSVMAGYRILKAMEASDAPVHVVVKSFAASMAAIITTLAEHSYAYPNAVLLHHQMSYSGRGNMTLHEENLKRAREWEERILLPLTKKLGTTPEAFVKAMYENESTGDWDEFADVAQQLKWVSHVVERLREAGVTKQPGAGKGGAADGAKSFLAPIAFDGEEQEDAQGRRFKRLPRLQPFDFYFVFDPQGYYRS